MGGFLVETSTKFALSAVGGFALLLTGLSMFGGQGRPSETVPDVAGMTISKALEVLDAQDIDIESDPPAYYPYDTLPLTGTVPAAGTEVRDPWAIEELIFQPITVTGVVDAQTVDLSTGDRVRFIGVQTPTAGECGAAEALQLVTDEILGKEVHIGNPPEVIDRTADGSLLAHVSSESIWSVGQLLILRGLATPANDGYDTYPQKELFERLSSENPVYSCDAPTEQRKLWDAGSRPGGPWHCYYSPSMDYDFYNDVYCDNGEEVVYPRLREWDDFVTETEMRESMREFENELNGK
jgi:hypothetical protein